MVVHRLLGVVLFTLLLAACASPAPTTGSGSSPSGASQSAAPQRATGPVKPLVIAVSTEPSTLDAQAVIDRNSRVASGSIFENLLDRDARAQIVPSLAERYEAVDDT